VLDGDALAERAANERRTDGVSAISGTSSSTWRPGAHASARRR
jgi:hypothetical protein